MQLNSGARVDLANGSEARVFSNHISLESGMSEVQSPSSFSIDARNFKIQPAEATSIARVRLEADQRVLVTAVSAPVNVFNHNGMLVARVMPAAPMAFLPQAAGGSGAGAGGAGAGGAGGVGAAGAAAGAAGAGAAGIGLGTLIVPIVAGLGLAAAIGIAVASTSP